MSSVHESGHDDLLVRYLLGLLPAEETERLDELAMVDDEVASRLRLAEDELVDAYVSGMLTGERRERFEVFYLSSPRRRERVRFAGSFLRAIDRAAGPPDAPAQRDPIRVPVAKPAVDAASRRPWYASIVLRASPAWTLVAVAAVLLLASGAVLVEEMRVRNLSRASQQERAALERRTQDLEQRLRDQEASNDVTSKELERVRASLPQQSPADRPADATPRESQRLSPIALVLFPQTRAAGPLPTLSLSSGVDRVRFELRLESDDFPRYHVALKDPATNRVVWRSGPLRRMSGADRSAVSVAVPATLLRPQHYSLELLGLRPDGTFDVVGSYAVQILFN
jgi:hypothetical protein